ncbi:MAG: hypothetical protein INH41_10595 [Myxococcaceae bacterium]|jgi:hypothetical protein|nr:hypothetical protein [Myxococcaceae bacterium]MCA3012833.1 hypothetical protein [Myxococcaceae bacterium]
MRSVRIGHRGSASLRRVEAPSASRDLGAALRTAGVSTRALFGWRGVAFRRVEAVAASVVRLDVGSRAVTLPRVLLPEVKAGQWVRLEQGPRGAVRASVDLGATLEAESRLNALFVSLSRR